MSINNIKNNNYISKIDRVLEKTKINDEIVNNINEILSLETVDDVLLDIKTFREK
jgi:flagellar basal body-associated protein FliL